MIKESVFFSYKSYLFDLDNTIIDETQYLFAVYSKIAKDVSLDKNEFIHLFLNEGRDKLFNKIIKNNNLPDAYLQDFLYTLRNIKLPYKLVIFPSISDLLKKLTILNKNLLIVTNGNINQQKNKIDQIDWQGIENNIHFVLADLIAPKPSVNLFNYLKKEYCLIEKETVLIGDSLPDEEFARNSNISFQNVISFF
jgi:phosphoglycolate phosphatase-like HAD superfamily hydrolase